METRILEIKQQLGDKLFIPGHHYQKDEVIQFADTSGDSLQLAQLCADNEKAEHVVFCGVHFMAETADIFYMLLVHWNGCWKEHKNNEETPCWVSLLYGVMAGMRRFSDKPIINIGRVGKRIEFRKHIC
jgi:hypothetical protein